MSTIVVVKKDEEIAIGADTLSKLSFTKESAEYIENHSKILQIENNFIAFVGHASFGLILKSYFNTLDEKPELNSDISIFEMAKELHVSLKENYFLNPVEEDNDTFESSQFDCLIANKTGIYGLYSLRSVHKYTKFYSFGTGYKFALGAMKSTYDMDLSAKEIAQNGLEAAVDFDDDSGSPIEIYLV